MPWEGAGAGRASVSPLPGAGHGPSCEGPLAPTTKDTFPLEVAQEESIEGAARLSLICQVFAFPQPAVPGGLKSSPFSLSL